MRIAALSLLAYAVVLAVVASPPQVPLEMGTENGGVIFTSVCSDSCLSAVFQVAHVTKGPKNRALHGRFLHITDMHPDPYYTPFASTSKSCHGKKAKKKSKRAGYWGTPVVFVIPYPWLAPQGLKRLCSECDSPLRLTNFTLDFLEKNWADEVDFVICERNLLSYLFWDPLD